MKNTNYIPRLKVSFDDEIAPKLKKELKLKNNYQVPQLIKVVVNSGLGKAKDDKKILEIASNTISKITGQKPVVTIAKQSIATFKLREGNKIGLKVTLRNAKMYEFTDRLINIILPRIRDFHGVSSTAFDTNGNYSIGFVDQSIFPELSFEETATAHGLQVIFVIKTESKDHSRKLLEAFGMPFEKEVRK